MAIINRPSRAFAALALATLLSPLPLSAQEVSSENLLTPEQILFVGNSYFYYNDSLHNHVRRMVRELQNGEDDNLQFRSITISGGLLEYHPIEYYMTPGTIGYATPFDMVILQGNSSAALSKRRRERFRDAAIAADKLIDATGAQTALYMTHAYAEGHANYSPDYIDKINELYTETGKAIDAIVIPVGLAFENAKAARPGIKLQQEYDQSHPELIGSYLAAATVVATIYNVSPVGLEYDAFGAIDAEMRTFLQTIAAKTVADYKAQYNSSTIQVNGNVISWPDDGWYQVQNSDGSESLCNGGMSCEVPDGIYLVINHTTGERFNNIVVAGGGDNQTSIDVNGNTISWPNDGWYQVQSADGNMTFCNGGTSCIVDKGTYLVINHTTGERFNNIIVSGS